MKMTSAIIITPVKDSIETALQTIKSVSVSIAGTENTYIIYNDNSTAENAAILELQAKESGAEIIHVNSLTHHPSPNYLFVLQHAQDLAISRNKHLIVIESDVTVKNGTITNLIELTHKLTKPGLIAAVTVDTSGQINFPYLYARKFKKGEIDTKKRLSFCCTLLSNNFLNSYSFKNLNPEKNWYDVFISHKSTELGFGNYLLTNEEVLHQPHSSRPWKNLKYTHPLKYYWIKFTQKKDKI